MALTPDAVGRLAALGLDLQVEAGAGAAAAFSDQSYEDAGASVVDTDTAYATGDVLLCVQLPTPERRGRMRQGQLLIGLLQIFAHPDLATELAGAGVTALSFEGLPRTLSRAQSMDALSSQANVAGYKSAIVAADAFGGYFPMLMTAAGTIRPAKVLVLGAGVAGLQAISTARRLGAVVTAYDVREAARAEIKSTGATFLELPGVGSVAAENGYARELTTAEQQRQAEAMDRAVGGFDVVITTAQVPGRRPPVLVSAAALAALQPGSVVVDLAAGPLGGNVEGSQPDASITTGNGVLVIGAGNLAAGVPRAASATYARNVAALLNHLLHDGELVLDPADEVTAGVLVTRDGDVVHPLLLARIAADEQGVFA